MKISRTNNSTRSVPNFKSSPTKVFTLRDLNAGDTAQLIGFNPNSRFKSGIVRLIELGFAPGTYVSVFVKQNDPRGSTIFIKDSVRYSIKNDCISLVMCKKTGTMKEQLNCMNVLKEAVSSGKNFVGRAFKAMRPRLK